MDTLKIEQHITGVLQSKKKELQLLEQLIEDYLLSADSDFKLFLELVKTKISWAHYKIRKEINTVADLYLVCKIIKTKIRALQTVLQSKAYVKKPKTQVCVLKLLQKYKDHILYFSQGVLCGKTKEASDKVYHKTCHEPWHYYHAKIHGGGLVALQEENPGLGNSLATLYSQYLKRTGSPLGISSHSTNVAKGRESGSFYFKTPTTLVRAINNLYVGISKTPVDNILHFSLSDKKENDKLNFLITPCSTSYGLRYEAVKNYYANKNITVKNYQDLDLLVPRLYQLTLC